MYNFTEALFFEALFVRGKKCMRGGFYVAINRLLLLKDIHDNFFSEKGKFQTSIHDILKDSNAYIYIFKEKLRKD